MKFINRQEEMARLNRLIKSDEAELAVIWGRRRMGKTRLLLEWVDKHTGIYYTADESSASVQRKYFAIALEQALPGFAAVEYPDWLTLFTRLAKEAMQMGWRGPLVIDELPYLISTSPEFPSILQRFIDHEAKRAKMIIALCGSSQRIMQGAILNASAPLFGRAKEIIKLGPISLGYMGEALEIELPREVIESYSVWGGIPRYWELVRSNQKSFLENVDDIVLNPMGALNDEPNRLLLEESSMSLRPILDAIGLGAHRLSEVATRIGQPVTSLARMVQRLLELDLIERELPFGVDEHNSKRTLYKIKDPFMRFWFEVVASQRSFFSQTTSSHRKNRLKESLQPIFSLAWEDICRSAIPHFVWKEHVFGQSGRYWHGSGPEWDIIAESIDGTALLIGEAKWLTKIPSNAWIYKTIEEIKNKGIPPVSRNLKAQLFYVLFIPEKPKNLNLPTTIRIVDAEEILKIL